MEAINDPQVAPYLNERIEAAKRIINKFGYIIIPFKTMKPLGFVTEHLWGVFVGYSFTLVSQATLEEWIAQSKIMESVTPGVTLGKENPIAQGYYLYKFITD